MRSLLHITAAMTQSALVYCALAAPHGVGYIHMLGLWLAGVIFMRQVIEIARESRSNR